MEPFKGARATSNMGEPFKGYEGKIDDTWAKRSKVSDIGLERYG